jgi:hypothetical protein
MSHETVEFENDRVKVTRIMSSAHEPRAKSSRRDRLIVYLQDGHVVRTEGGNKEEIRRKAGDVVWRDRSEHHVESHKDGHEVLVIELKK